jgi:hypothetical protein
MASQRRAPSKRPPRPAAKKAPPPPGTSDGADGVAGATDQPGTTNGTTDAASTNAIDSSPSEGLDAADGVDEGAAKETVTAPEATTTKTTATKSATNKSAPSTGTVTKGRPTPTKSGGRTAVKAGGPTAKPGAPSKPVAAAKSGGTTAKSRPTSPTPKTGGPNYRPPTGAARTTSRLPPPRKKKRVTRKTIVAAIGIVLIATLVIFFAFAVNGASSSNPSATTTAGPEGIAVPTGPVLAAVNTSQYPTAIDGISCNTSEQLVYHIHVHLTIFVNGSARLIPYGVGITPPLQLGTTDGTFVDGGTCFYWLHTHAYDGIIHVESPTQKTYTLGEFFDEWGQPLKSNQVGPAVGKLTIYQDGKIYTGDPRALQLTAHNQIQLDVGSPAPTQTLVTNWGQL